MTRRRVHVEWGAAGAAALARSCATVVVCDVLSFTTTVSIGVSRGVVVWPSRDDTDEAARRAEELDLVLAGPRSSAVSLSPESFLSVPAGTAVLLPSPNGATCCMAAAGGDAAVVAGSLRNAPAVARWVKRRTGDVGVVAAGERWPDGSLRPAYEDWVGAGAIVDLLRRGATLSPEADAAALAARSRRSLRETASGIELVQRGYDSDVDLAEEDGADDVVPLLDSGRFVAG